MTAVRAKRRAVPVVSVPAKHGIPGLKKTLTLSSLALAAAIIVFAITVVYYYFTTSPTSVLISTADFPASLTPGFTPDELVDRLEAHLHEVIATADSGLTSELSEQEGLIHGPISERVIPVASTSVPSPVFNQKVHGMTLNLARGLGMSLRAKRLLEITVIGVPQGGWQLAASLKEWPQYSARSVGSAPKTGGKCLDFESCADDLAEQILEVLNDRRLLEFYIKRNTETSNRQIIDLYQTASPSVILQPDDLVTWGNAFFVLSRYDDALQKYQEALRKDNGYCPARIGRGLVFYYRDHGSQELADLKLAEEDFGSACGAHNKFAHADLCDTLLKEWRISASGEKKTALLTQAYNHCAAALSIDQQFVRAAVTVAYILYRQRRYQDSLRGFEDLGQQYPASSGVFITYGFVLYNEYLRLRNASFLGFAIEKTQHAWDLNQKSRATANNLGAFCYEQGDYRRAVESWRKALFLKSNDADVRAGLALGLEKLKDHRSALESFIEAARLDSHYCQPNYLKQHRDWSECAASDLAAFIAKLPANLNGQSLQNLCPGLKFVKWTSSSGH